MKKILFLVLFFSARTLFAGNSFYLLGARSLGMGGASVSLSDFWSTENNQAGLGFLKDVGGGLYYENRFGIKEMSIKAGAFAYPLKSGALGISVSSYGFNLYNENKAGISYGQRFSEKFSAGIQLNYVSTQLGENYGKRQSFTGAVGIMAKLSNELTLAAHLYNPTRTKLSDYNNEKIPTIMRIGLMYTFSEKVILTADVDKNIYEKPIVKSGIEYHPIPILYFRMGIATNPTQNNFGVGIQTKELRIDIATGYHSKLGFSPAVSLAYQPFK
ncbi:MAG: hypothetical protein HND27_03840 [Bacteroidetes bacterium]|nr:hypothetical protein [Bacteroidota bacterium]MBV6460217.1 hypothetical protein [Flavobacteriales bacterium]WKZ74586.1 MAG: hypothetical protein QY303_10575 [Vicingaceae bacterium]MCL4816871.1 hypothetical protein [Flavobacteriales bacterium]NOG94892.1 hypothetical protein [Bacteroidota bacterium]